MNTYKIVVLFLIVLTAACASKNSSKKIQKDAFNWLSNNDFKEQELITVNLDNDYYKELNIEDKVFKSETMSTVVNKVSDEKFSSKDPLTQATYLCHKGNFSKSDEILKKVFKKNHKNPRYFNIKGICFMKKKQIDFSLISFNKAISLNRKYSPAFNNIGVIYFERKLYYQALKYFKIAYKNNLFSRTPKYNLANVYLSNGLFPKAEPLLLDLYSDDSMNNSVNLSLALLYLYKSDIRSSFLHFSKLPNIEKSILNTSLQKAETNKSEGFKYFSSYYQSLFPGYSNNLKLLWSNNE